LFRHSSIYCNRDSHIQEPSDLKGKKIGVFDYQITAAVWIRGFLQHDYDVYPEDLKWFVEEEGREQFKHPEGVSIKKVPIGKRLEDLLVRGDLDALIAPAVPKCVVEGSSKVKRLFQNFEEVEMKYYQKTKIFPIMHTVVLKEKLWKRHRWIATSLMQAFEKAKQMTYLRYKTSRMTNNDNEYSYPWVSSFIEKQISIFGPDLYPYNLKENKKTLCTLIHYAHEQGLIKNEPDPRQLFAENTV
jgi:4,5-dihydroxyphthalate decarboxylase